MPDIRCPFCFHSFPPTQVHFRSIRDDDLVEDYEYSNYRREVFGDNSGVLLRPRTYNAEDASGEEAGAADPKVEMRKGIPYAYHVSDFEYTDNRICPFCHNPLPEKAGFCEQLMVAFVGDTQSGKTVLFLSIMRSITETFINNGDVMVQISVDRFFDADAGSNVGTTEYYGSRLREFNRGILPEPTQVVQNKRMPPIVYNVGVSRTGKTNTSYVVCMYDMPGELLDDPANWGANAESLRQSDATIFIVDPVNFPGVEDVIGGNRRVGDRAMSMAANMIAAWDLAHHEGDTNEQYPFAIAISKSDAIKEAESQNADGYQMVRDGANNPIFTNPEPNPHTQGFDQATYNTVCVDSISYLENVGRRDVVNFGRMHQEEVGVFMISALGEMPEPAEIIDEITGETRTVKKVQGLNGPIRITEPLLWILWKLGVIPTKPQPKRKKRCWLFG